MRILKSTFVGIGASLLASFALGQEVLPWECLIDSPKGSVEPLVCRNYDPTTSKSYSNVCMFHKGMWRRGDVSYSASKGAHEFRGRTPCTRGITALQLDDKGRMIGPSVVSGFKNDGEVTYDETKKEFTAANVTTPTTLHERAAECAINGTFTGPTEFLPCSQLPNEAGFCRKIAFKSGSYKGLWWVRFSEANQQSAEVCRYGVKLQDFKTKSDVEMKRYIISSTTTPVTSAFLTSPAILTSLGRGENQSIAACLSDEATALVRYSCSEYLGRVSSGGAVPTQVVEGRCYLYVPVPGAGWTAAYAMESGEFNPGRLKSCARLERVVFTHLIPSGYTEE